MLYTRILYTICTQMSKTRERKNIFTPTKPSSNLKPSDSQTTIKVNTKPSNEITIRHVKQKSRDYDNGRQLTISLMTATTISYAGSIVFISIVLLQVTNPNLYMRIEGTMTSILYRFFFLNNAVNPVVFCFLDRRFREECLSIIYKRCTNAKEEHSLQMTSTQTLDTTS